VAAAHRLAQFDGVTFNAGHAVYAGVLSRINREPIMGAYDDTAAFARRVLITLGLLTLIGLLVYFLGLMLDVFMLVFAAILLTVAVDGLVRVVNRHTPLGRGWSLLVSLLLILLVIAGVFSLIVPQAVDQIPRLVQQLPQAVEEVMRLLPWAEDAGDEIAEQMEEGNGLMGGEVFGQAMGIFSTTLGAVGSLSLILLIAVYLLINPWIYVNHLLQLIPQVRRARIAEMFRIQAQALRLWLLGRLLSMLFVGVTATIGLVILDVPMAFSLGLIAGLATFIPYLGPIIGAVPAILVAFLESPQIALYVVMLYFVVETVESSLIYPLAQRRVVHIPPAYTVVIQIGGGLVGGVPGVILATPLAVVAAVAIQMLYVEDVLGESVEVLGD